MNEEKLAQDKQILKHNHKDIRRIIEYKYSNTEMCTILEESEQNSKMSIEYNLDQISEKTEYLSVSSTSDSFEESFDFGLKDYENTKLVDIIKSRNS